MLEVPPGDNPGASADVPDEGFTAKPGATVGFDGCPCEPAIEEAIGCINCGGIPGIPGAMCGNGRGGIIIGLNGICGYGCIPGIMYG